MKGFGKVNIYFSQQITVAKRKIESGRFFLFNVDAASDLNARLISRHD